MITGGSVRSLMQRVAGVNSSIAAPTKILIVPIEMLQAEVITQTFETLDIQLKGIDILHL